MKKICKHKWDIKEEYTTYNYKERALDVYFPQCLKCGKYKTYFGIVGNKKNSAKK